ncbi:MULTISPECIES: hypothetical protein [unclassified Streptomyces]|uniref:hypothetical protein n=1 Tax=unclassified Streptomyces TaxID=2593676 RepID=UPI0033B31088
MLSAALKPDESGDMQITHRPGRGLVAAVVSSIGMRHEGAHARVATGLYLDLNRVLRNPADDPRSWRLPDCNRRRSVLQLRFRAEGKPRVDACGPEHPQLRRTTNPAHRAPGRKGRMMLKSNRAIMMGATAVAMTAGLVAGGAGPAQAAGGTAPACIERQVVNNPDGGMQAWLYNKCGRSMRVKVVVKSWRDTSCKTIPNRHSAYFRTLGGRYDRTAVC